MPNVTTNPPPHNLKIELFRLRCEARALLWAHNELTLHDAVDILQDWAVTSGLVHEFGQDTVQHIMAVAFEQERRKMA